MAHSEDNDQETMWWIIGGVSAGVVLIAFLVYYFYFRGKTAYGVALRDMAPF